MKRILAVCTTVGVLAITSIASACAVGKPSPSQGSYGKPVVVRCLPKSC